MKLEFGKYYHIYNRGNNKENIFIEERNYLYFLKLYQKYIEPVAETYSYCLLKNHFHFLIRVRSVDEQVDFLKNIKACEVLKTSQGSEKIYKLLTPSQQFSNLFNSYTKSINKAYNRTGSLFQEHFNRIEVETGLYFLNLVHYINFNPQKHKFVDDFRKYPYSSYNSIISEKPTKLKRDELLKLFGSRDEFIKFHNKLPDESSILHLIELDDDF